ncbi:MAG: arylsulfotransferase family protein [Gemmatimonadota bacterium]|nr:arylsulfotransferase family protein [Gemmatimonadota bacterium]
MLSVAVLAWFYGYATSANGWFPNDLLLRAWSQADAVNPVKLPVYLHKAVYEREGATTHQPGSVHAGLTLLASAWTDVGGELRPGLRLIDRKGNVLHSWTIDPVALLDGAPPSIPVKRDLDIQGTYLFPNGDVLINLEYAGTFRLDACGRVLWGVFANNHHSIARADDGSFWTPAGTRGERGSPGHPDGFPGIGQAVFQDQLMRISEDGEVLETVDVLDILYQNGLEWHLAEEDMLDDIDPTHVNDVEPLPDSLASQYPLFEAGDLLVSMRELDMVMVVDPESGRIKWHTTEGLIVQHDPDFIGDGWIGVFDNRRDGAGGSMLGGSRIVAFQPHTDSTKVLFPTPRSDPFYTDHRGKWQLLDGNMLLVEEGGGRVVEVAPDGSSVWDWVVEPYGEGRIPAVTGATRVDLSPEEVAAWPCAHAGSGDTATEGAS